MSDGLHSPGPFTEGEANARLFAAARELLIELECWHSNSVVGGWHECDPDICPAVAAITKAKGV